MPYTIKLFLENGDVEKQYTHSEKHAIDLYHQTVLRAENFTMIQVIDDKKNVIIRQMKK